MGGTIRVIVRENEDKVHNMYRWTNTFPDFVNSPKLYNEDKDHLSKYMESWLDMKEDYDKNCDSGDYEFYMTPSYFPNDNNISPSGYGILIIDYVTKKIISCQGYAKVGNLSGIKFAGLFSEKARNLGIRSNTATEEEQADAKQMFDEGRLEIFEYWDDEIICDNGKVGNWVQKKMTPDEVSKFLEKNDCYEITGIINPEPWEIFSFWDDAEGLINTKKEIIKAGFNLTEEDEKIWEEEIKEQQINEETYK